MFKRILGTLFVAIGAMSHVAVAQDCAPRVCEAMKTKGNILFSSSNSEATGLPIGSTSQILSVDSSGIPRWTSTITGATVSGNLTFTGASPQLDFTAASGSPLVNYPALASFQIYRANNLVWAFNSSGQLVQDGTNGGDITLSAATTQIKTTLAAARIILNSTGGGGVSVGTSTSPGAENGVYIKQAGNNTWAFNSSGQLAQDATNGSDILLSKAGTTLSVKGGGAAATSGTFTCNGVTAVVVNTTAASTGMALAFSPNTISGTAAIGSPYVSAISAGTSFSVKCSVAGETSTYNWAMIKVT